MPQIKILPSDLRNKISAGEVIERPASVVKELIENSIDAGSTDIRIDILYGGKRLIKVSDNGTGMDKEDALLCFERYATSKLFSEKDLFNIKTLGFRGEALSSIAAVSKVRLVTGTKDSPSGVSIEIHGGERKAVKDFPAVGTVVEVRDLFFNTPARRKFLKSNATELFHVIDTVTKEALSHWEIGFSLTTDNQPTMTLPLSSGPKERIMQVYGEEFLKYLVEICAETDGMKINAFVTKCDNFRNSKAHQFIFINRRPIKDNSITHAVYKAYEGILPAGKHPIFFLFLDIDTHKVDLNVHPAKREVRFFDKESVYRFVTNSIREVVSGKRTEPQEAIISENLELSYNVSLPFIHVGDTFIATAGNGGIILIDYHSAHERVLYEKLLKGINLNPSQLLFPIQVRLPHKEYRIILENAQILRDFAIEVDDFGHNTVVVRSLPLSLREADLRGLLSDIVSCIIESSAPATLKEVLAAKIACHSSMRGKKIFNQEEISHLVAELEKTEHPDQCPHGRPTRIFISLEELKKMFKKK